MIIEGFAVAHLMPNEIIARCSVCGKALSEDKYFFVIAYDAELVTHLVWAPRPSLFCCEKEQVSLLSFENVDDACAAALALVGVADMGFEFPVTVREYPVPRHQMVQGYPDEVTE